MRYIFLNLFFLLSVFSNAQNWQSFTDSIGTFSSARSSDLTGDGVMDIVIGGGVDSLFSNNGVMAHKSTNTINDIQIGTTTYDLQSNALIKLWLRSQGII